MNAKNKVLLYSLILGVVFYFVDALIYQLVHSEDYTFVQSAFTAVPVSEIYSRLLMILGFLIFGFIVSGLIYDLSIENEFLKHQPLSASSGKVDTGFVNGLSYQVRTPLNAIVGFSELLKDPNIASQSKQTYINHIHSSGNYLIQLMNNLTDIVKLESNQLIIHKNEFDLNKLMDEVCSEYEQIRKEMGKAGLSFMVKKGIRQDVFMIICDRERLRQVLFNLLENAFKLTEEGMVEFGYKIKEERLLDFYVKDTGTGFSIDRLEVIFNRYRRLTDNQNQPFDTTSLRLGISKSLVKLMGGTMWADSRMGQGSTFYFSLPFEENLTKTETAPVHEPAPPRKTTRDWNKRVILIAEDVESNFIYLQELLRPTGIGIVWAQNGKIAVEQIKKDHRIELVLMDILMPEMDGIEAARQVKKIRPELPVIAQTAYSLETETEKEDLANFNGFLIKPIWSPQLLGILEKYIN